MSSSTPLKFVPSRVEGVPNVTEAAIHPDRMELKSGTQWVTFDYAQIAKWPSPVWLWKLLFKAGCGPCWLPVADRRWLAASPSSCSFSFYSSPPVVVNMPEEEFVGGSAETYFERMKAVMRSGGFSTFDVT